MELIISLIIIIISSVIIMYACDSFDDSASYLGRNMAPGVKGATINAIGSSMPELMTAFFLLFLFHERDGFAAGIATTAGSAIFNSVVIPAVCIFTVRYKGIIKDSLTSNGEILRKKIQSFNISKSSLLRDGFFLLLSEAALIWFLSGTTMSWWMALILNLIYISYFFFLAKGFGSSDEDDMEDDEENDEDEEQNSTSKIKALFTLDFNSLFFNSKEFSTTSAWVVLLFATLSISAACWALAEAVMMSAEALSIPPYFTAIIFAAAATSVPDTILSIKDATRGDYDDAISNAVGSNTFDITVGLGLPLLLYTVIHNTDVIIISAPETQLLRIILLCITFLVIASLMLQRKITVFTAYFFIFIYFIWMLYIFNEAFIIIF